MAHSQKTCMDCRRNGAVNEDDADCVKCVRVTELHSKKLVRIAFLCLAHRISYGEGFKVEDF